MKCFEEYIGVFGCHNETAKLRYINDIPGMHNELLESITDSERSTYRQVFVKALTAGVNSLRSDLEQTMWVNRERHEWNSELYRSQRPMVVIPKVYEYTSKRYIGVLVKITGADNVELQVKSLMVDFRDSTIVYPVIFDAESGEGIERGEQIDLEAGSNTINFDIVIKAENTRAVFVGLELTAPVEIAEMHCNNFERNGCNTCDPCASIDSTGNEKEFKNINNDDEFGIYSVTSGDLVNWEEGDFICADVLLVCSMDIFMCKNAQFLSDTLIYKVAYNVLTEKMASPRQNMWAKSNPDFTFALREEYGKEYEKRIKRIAPKLVKDGICWECVKSGAYIESIV